MELKLKTLTITDYDALDENKVKLSYELSTDPLVERYVFPDVDRWFRNTGKVDKMQTGDTLMVKDSESDELVGFFKFHTFFDSSMSMDYGISPRFRNKGYGTKILLEVSDYFLDNGITDIVLCIDMKNEASRKCALKAGFVQDTFGYNVDRFVKEKSK